MPPRHAATPRLTLFITLAIIIHLFSILSIFFFCCCNLHNKINFNFLSDYFGVCIGLELTFHTVYFLFIPGLILCLMLTFFRYFWPFVQLIHMGRQTGNPNALRCKIWASDIKKPVTFTFESKRKRNGVLALHDVWFG